MSHPISSNTGFGKVSRWVATHFDQTGHNVFAVHQTMKGLPIYPRRLNYLDMKNLVLLPIGDDPWGSDVIPGYIDEYDIDIVWTLLDIWCNPWIADQGPTWIRHITFDTANTTEFWLSECKIRETDIPIAFSKFGRQLLLDHGVDWGTYIPHGVDVKTYRPLKASEDRGTIRRRFGLPEDAFIVGMVAHNQIRKNIDRWLYAFQEFASKNPDAYAVLHTQPKDKMGWDINILLQELDLVGRVYFTNLNAKLSADLWVTEKDMARLYKAMDVHMLLTGGEGFGLPIIESMACGIPNVATAWTTPIEFFSEQKTEVITKDDGTEEEIVVMDCQRGLLVDIETVLVHHTAGQWAAASARHAAQMLQLLHDDEGLRKSMGKKARDFVVRDYAWPKILKKWDRVIDNPERYMKPQAPPPGKRKMTLADLGV